MGNVLVKLKRFLGNKNTITIICVLIGVGVLLFGYNYRVNQAVQPVNIPYAMKRMEPKTKVEAENVGTIKVSGAFVEQTTDLIKSKAIIVNEEWYVNYDTVIPEGGLFYSKQLVKKEDLPDTAFDKIESGVARIFSTVFSTSTLSGAGLSKNLSGSCDNL